MECKNTINGSIYKEMLKGGAEVLSEHKGEVDDLNVFPIPDGDTGENMLLTIKGGSSGDATEDLSDAAKAAADGMMLSARGNSGVILSQFFDGISHGFESVSEADESCLEAAFRQGVDYAYKAVINPTEGTILTVLREATDYACAKGCKSPAEFLDAFLKEARRSLERTPELLPVLKNAGVVDSGGAGIVYIAEGMQRALRGEQFGEASVARNASAVDYSCFDENSVLEFGYCTELLLRLQRAKCEPESFDAEKFRLELDALGDSVVTVIKGTAVKVHVHTKTPSDILTLCQKYGEFLSVKIENMSLQHNSRLTPEEAAVPKRTAPKKELATVAVANGQGVIEAFHEMGADEVIDGGRSLNPSSEDFVSAFERTGARTVIVFPNNSNSVLAAKQAGALWDGGTAHVVETRSIGEGYAALSMLDTDSREVPEAIEACREAIAEARIAEITRCVRDTEMDGFSLREGEYIAVSGKHIVAAGEDIAEAFSDTLSVLGLDRRDILIIIRGKGLSEDAADELTARAAKDYPRAECYVIDGGQDVYDCILIAE